MSSADCGAPWSRRMRARDRREVARGAGLQLGDRREHAVCLDEIALLHESEREIDLRERDRAVVREPPDELRRRRRVVLAQLPARAELRERRCRVR
jgi:hypothetical protein